MTQQDEQYETVGQVAGAVRKPLIALGVLLCLAIGKGMFTSEVPAGSVGFTKTFGAVGDTYHGPGLMFKLPWQTVVNYSTRTVAEARDADLRDNKQQQLKGRVAVQLWVKPEQAIPLYKAFGDFDDLRSKVIDPEIQQESRAATPTYSAEDLIAKRPELVSKIQSNLQAALSTQLSERGADGALSIGQISMMTFRFSDSFEQIIENNVKTDQERQTAVVNKQIAEINADAAGQKTEIEAAANAEATRLLADANAYAIKVKGDAAKANQKLGLYEAITNWDGEPATYNIGHSPLIISPPVPGQGRNTKGE